MTNLVRGGCEICVPAKDRNRTGLGKRRHCLHRLLQGLLVRLCLRLHLRRAGMSLRSGSLDRLLSRGELHLKRRDTSAQLAHVSSKSAFGGRMATLHSGEVLCSFSGSILVHEQNMKTLAKDDRKQTWPLRHEP